MKKKKNLINILSAFTSCSGVMAEVTDFGAGTSSLQLHTEGRGSTLHPAKAKFGRLSWERLTSPREGEGTRQGGSPYATTWGASESQARLESMLLGEGVSLSGSLDPLALPEMGVVLGYPNKQD